jgi:hypothetical protein
MRDHVGALAKQIVPILEDSAMPIDARMLAVSTAFLNYAMMLNVDVRGRVPVGRVEMEIAAHELMQHIAAKLKELGP